MLKITNFAKELSLLIKIHLIRNRKALSLVVATFVLICCLVYIDSGYKYADRAIIVIASFILSAVYALLISMNDYYRHNRVYTAQLLPATTKAKFASEVIVSLIIIPVVLIVIGFAIDYGVYIASKAESYIFPIENWGSKITDILIIPFPLYFLIILNSSATLIKTRLNWIFLVMIALAILAMVPMSYIGAMSDYPGVDCYFYSIRNGFQSAYTSVIVHSAWAGPNVTLWATRIWLWALPVACYIWAYFRFKEWESR